MKYNKEQKERIFKIYKKLQKISEPLANICDVHINIKFSSDMHYVNGFYGEKCFMYNTGIVVEDYYNINKRTFIILVKHSVIKIQMKKLRKRLKN